MTDYGPSESETCSEYVLPAIVQSGWGGGQVLEQFPVLNDSAASSFPSIAKRRADYVLELQPGVPLVVIEAKRLWSQPGDGLQQAIRYAQMLDAPFAMSTNGTGWTLHNMISGSREQVDFLPTPAEAWDLYVTSRGLNEDAKSLLLSRFSDHHRESEGSVRHLRYYQRRAVHEVLMALAAGSPRALVVMATGTGKTFTAMQLVWKLWSYRKERQRSDNTLRNYRVLFLADRDVLVKDPLNKTFVQAFQEAATRVSHTNRRHSPDIYFATYQALDAPSGDGGSNEADDLLSNYPSDFFDLVIVDECHRGSARENSAWRAILEHFEPAAQLGLTATPIRAGAVDTFNYFGNPIYQYSLRQGIEDGFLAPYTIRRIEFDVDIDGLEVLEGMTDIAGRRISPAVYSTKDFERVIRLPDRTRAIARVIHRVLGESRDRAVIFCVDSVHALSMVSELQALRPERTALEPEWVVRIMSVEREKDRLLEQFTDPDRRLPQVAVSTRLLSTGVDIQDLRYVIIARPVSSVSEFKQIIGRGTRLYPEKGKLDFEILDFVGATSRFSDPEFDGPPLRIETVDVVDESGILLATSDPRSDTDGTQQFLDEHEHEHEYEYDAGAGSMDSASRISRDAKFELRGIPVTIVSEGFWVHDVESGGPRLVSYTDWARERVLDSFAEPNELLAAWSAPASRLAVLSRLREVRVDPARLSFELGLSSEAPVDTVDQLLQLAWNRPALSRADRARRVRSAFSGEIASHSEQARAILDVLLDLYARRGIDEISSSAITLVPPLSVIGTPSQIAREFGGAAQWHQVRLDIQQWLYSA